MISLQMRVTRCGSLPGESPSDTPSHIWFWGVDASGSHGTGNAARPVPAAGVVVHEKTCGLMTRLLKREGMQLQVNDGVRAPGRPTVNNLVCMDMEIESYMSGS